MNRAKVKNLLLNTASVYAAVTETESVPFTTLNPNLNIVLNRNSRLHVTSAALIQIPKKTMHVFPDSS